MKKLALVALIALTGCTKYIVKPEVVEVKYPVPYCPAVTDVIDMPPIELETLKLTEADKQEHGKVARAYHIDMVNLTQRLAELNRIETARSQQAAEIKAQLEKYQAEIARIHKENMEKVTSEVLQKQQELNK